LELQVTSFGEIKISPEVITKLEQYKKLQESLYEQKKKKAEALKREKGKKKGPGETNLEDTEIEKIQSEIKKLTQSSEEFQKVIKQKSEQLKVETAHKELISTYKEEIEKSGGLDSLLQAKTKAMKEADKNVGLHDTVKMGKELGNLTQALAGSLKECNFFTKYSNDQKYTPFMTLSILWAFMYRKMAEKQEFAGYCDGLGQELGKLVAKGQTVFASAFDTQIKSQDWVSDVFGKNDTEKKKESDAIIANLKVLEGGATNNMDNSSLKCNKL
ncbi:MAG: hypothetical protein ABH827_02630, partial [bacterium]